MNIKTFCDWKWSISTDWRLIKFSNWTVSIEEKQRRDFNPLIKVLIALNSPRCYQTRKELTSWTQQIPFSLKTLNLCLWNISVHYKSKIPHGQMTFSSLTCYLTVMVIENWYCIIDSFKERIMHSTRTKRCINKCNLNLNW